MPNIKTSIYRETICFWWRFAVWLYIKSGRTRSHTLQRTGNNGTVITTYHTLVCRIRGNKSYQIVLYNGQDVEIHWQLLMLFHFDIYFSFHGNGRFWNCNFIGAWYSLNPSQRGIDLYPSKNRKNMYLYIIHCVLYNLTLD